MSSRLALVTTIFPFDPSIDTPFGHRNLVAIYLIVLSVQVGHGVFALVKWTAAKTKAKQLGRQ